MGRSSESKKHSKKSDSNSSDSSCDSEKARKKAKRLKRKEEKLTEKLKKIEKKRLKKLKKKAKRELAIVKNGNKIVTPLTPPERVVESEEKSANVPIGLMEQSRSMAPMTKEEWEKRQSQVRRVLDEESGRYRLIKGDGEVIEEIVSQKRHREINQQATQADGAFFQAKTSKR